MHGILEAPEPRINQETNSALAPFPELSEDIFGDERDLRGPADEFVLLRIAFRRDKREVRGSVGRRYGDEMAPGKFLISRVKNELETELVHVELEAAIQVANIDTDGLQAQIRVPAVQANRRPVQPFMGRASHGPAL